MNQGDISRRAPVVSLGLFADAHYAEMVYGDRHCKESPAKLAACIDTFEQGELDFVVCMGDIIDKSEDHDVELGYLVRMREIFAGFNGPRHFVMGNHDVTTLTKDEVLQECGTPHPAYYSFDVAMSTSLCSMPTAIGTAATSSPATSPGTTPGSPLHSWNG